ncbi:MAG: aldehyde dehydrogenase [Rhodospirillaceae bacterium]|nr:aldehyde dehydrogenase [Rhodospirillaceae bacterium]|tara:strand:+ start:17264 stop:18709 length:1446 start_codon:yes stop_codon:yes gene_type:complete
MAEAQISQPWIGGQSYAATGGKTEELRSPWDDSLVATVAMADEATIDAAVSNARVAFLSNLSATPAERAVWLRKAADEVDAVKDEIADITMRALGKPKRACGFEAGRVSQLMRLCAEELLRMEGEVLPLDALPMGAGRFGFTRHHPHGVIAAFTPFNAPSNLLMQKVAPAIAMGNAVVVKPAFEGIGEALMIAEAFTRAGVPDGLVNVVACRRDVTGYFVAHKDVAVVTLTGGTAAGEALAKAAGAKPFIGELGGNSANIVCADADVKDAALRIVPSAFEASGQQCISAQRIIVEDSVLDEFLEHFVATAEAMNVGDPTKDDTDVGPMVNVDAADRVEAMVEEAVANGAKAALPLKRDNAIIYPTILVGPKSDARVVCEEIFGPVAVVIPATDIDDAIKIANDSEFGLQSSCFTSSLETAFKVSEELHVGSVWINEGSRFRMDTTPFGGVRSSGYGREGVKYAMEELSYVKFTGIRFPGRE